MRGSSHPVTGTVAVLLTALAAVAVGILPEALSVIAVLGLCAAGLLVLALIMVRLALAREATPPVPDGAHPAARPDSAPSEPDSLPLRLARGLFYLGSLLVGESAFRYFGLTVSEMMFVAAFSLGVWALLRGAAVAPLPVPMLAAAGVFAVGGALSSFDAQSMSGSAAQLAHALYVILGWPWLAAMVLRNRAHIHTAVACWVTSAALDGAGAIAQLAHLHVPGLLAAGVRMTGFTEHPNDLGGVCAIALVPALLVAMPATRSAGARRRALSWLAVALIGAGLALSGSVSGMAAAAVAVIFWLSSPSVRTPVRAGLAAAIVVGLLALTLLGTSVSTPVQRLTQVGSATSQQGGSVQDRLSIATQAWPRIVHDPFIGTGLDTADSVATIISHGSVTSYQIHGLALAAQYQTGIFGLLGMLALLAVLGALAWAGIRAARGDSELLTGQALLGAFVAFVIVAMVQPMVFQQYGWVTAALILAWHLRVDAARDPLEHRLAVAHPAASLAAIRQGREAQVTLGNSMGA